VVTAHRLVVAAFALAACSDGAIVIEPVIDTPPAGSEAAAFSSIDEIVMSLAREGEAVDLVAATFARGEALALADVPTGADLVLHMIGRAGGSESAVGRTCAFSIDPDAPPPAPHLYFSSTVQWGEAAVPPSPIRFGGDGVAFADGSGLYAGGTEQPGGAGAAIVGVDHFDPVTGVFEQLGAATPRTGARFAPFAGRGVIAGGREAAGLAAFVELVTVDAVPGRRIERFESPELAATELALEELSDGKVAAFGGRDAAGVPIDTVVLIVPEGAALSTRRLGAVLATPRAGHTATRLSDDPGAPVLIAGGVDAAGAPVGSAELFKPLFESFADPMTFDRPMVVPRSGHRAARLPDGSVLVLGGVDGGGMPVRTVEQFSLDAGFVEIQTRPPGAGLTELSITPLPDGRLLIAGGRDQTGAPVRTAYIARLDTVDGVPDIFPTDPLAEPRAGHQATLLCDGTVLLVGGTAAAAPAERYNPSSLGRR
jgi:hypothetical protein